MTRKKEKGGKRLSEMSIQYFHLILFVVRNGFKNGMSSIILNPKIIPCNKQIPYDQILFEGKQVLILCFIVLCLQPL